MRNVAVLPPVKSELRGALLKLSDFENFATHELIAMARAFLDDPHWAWHAAQVLGADVPRPPQYQRVGPSLWPGAALRG